ELEIAAPLDLFPTRGQRASLRVESDTVNGAKRALQLVGDPGRQFPKNEFPRQAVDVTTAGSQQGRSRVERDAIHRDLMSPEVLHEGARFGVPDLHALVSACGRQQQAVIAELHAGNACAVSVKVEDQCPRV